MQVLKIGLLLFCGLIFMPLKSAEISAEARRFLTARPADAQQQMASAVIQALDGNFEPLNTLRQSMLIDCPPPSGVTVQNLESSGCPIRFYYPAAERSDTVLLYLHGGGWTVGGIEGSAKFCGNFASESGLDVATLDYRLAPESKAPAALEDTLNAVKLLQDKGYKRIYLAGDSAGGNLAACTALKLRTAISGIVLFYPVVSLIPEESGSWQLYGEGFGLDSALMDAFNRSYAPGDLANSAEVSPLHAAEFKDYPPTLLIAAECDILFDQGKRFIDRLTENGISARHICVAGALHAFMTYPDMDNAYNEGLTEALNFISEQEEQFMHKLTDESIVRISRITVNPDYLPDYIAMVAECGRVSMSTEPGVIMMYSMQDQINPEEITILEIYRDQRSYDSHINSPHFRKYKSGTLKMINKLELLDQTPLVPEMKMK